MRGLSDSPGATRSRKFYFYGNIGALYELSNFGQHNVNLWTLTCGTNENVSHLIYIEVVYRGIKFHAKDVFIFTWNISYL